MSSFITPQTSSGPWFGEYMALVSTATIAYVAFTSTALEPLGDVLFTSFSNPVVNTAINETIIAPDEPMVYPNPTNESINIDIGNNQDIDLEIFDFSGKRIMAQHLIDQFTTIDLSNYTPGIY